MIHLRHDCLVFELSSGEKVPCSAEEMAFELILGPGESLDVEVVRNAAAAVLHYFRNELLQTAVSVGEFAVALRRALRSLGFDVREGAEPKLGVATHSVRKTEVNLADLGKTVGIAGELYFFHALRANLVHQLQSDPELIVFRGLRTCTKDLCAAQRWTERCQSLSDEIVAYLRSCMKDRPSTGRCVLCVC